MKKAKTKGNRVVKQFLSGMLATLLVAALAFGLITFAAAEKLDSSRPLPTNYDTVKNQAEEKTEQEESTGEYVKADYKVAYSDRYQKNLGAIYPSAEHVSANQAAEIVAQEIWKIYCIGMEGQTIQLTLYPDHGRFSSDKRPEWICEVNYGDYSKETATGTLNGGFTVTLDGIDGSVESALFVSELQSGTRSAKEYEDAARKIVTDLKLLDGPIESVTCFDLMEDFPYPVDYTTKTNYKDLIEYGGNVGVVAENGDIVMLTVKADDLSIYCVSYGKRAAREYREAEKYAA